ncbi:MAG: 8-amino-7-oxononanoate synthase [Pyrinomonadaceae bacterium]|nr:8-amino-7-oxononanoate synthase [Pyrinomonadaceae bacterium]
MTEGLKARIVENLAETETKNLTRKLVSPKGHDFSSNDFLCLANDERLISAAITFVANNGLGATGSRLLRGERDIFADVENQFANFKRTESALYFSSGFQANIGVLQTFLEPDDVVFSDELNHASLIDGIRLSKCRKIIFNHLDIEQVEKHLRQTDCRGQKFLVTESLFSMNGDIAPLRDYAEICRKTNTNLIVDEAHAVGVYGLRGSGLIEQNGIDEQVFLSINTAGKAFGVSGAFVAGDDITINYLINKCRSFIFSTAPMPAAAAALKVAIEIVENERDKRENLLNSSRFFRHLLAENSIDVTFDDSQIIPIVIGDSGKTLKIAQMMQSQGFDVRAIRPPTVPVGTSRLRVSLNVGLTREILTDFVVKLSEAIKNCK